MIIMLIGTWRKGNPSYNVARNLNELYSTVLGKVEFASNKTRYLIEKTSKQSVKEITWFLLNAYNKIQKEREEFRME